MPQISSSTHSVFRILVATALPLCFANALLAQSSSRVDVLPSVAPVQAQPSYTPYPQPVATGGNVVSVPTTGTPIVNSPVVSGPVVESAMPVQGNVIYESAQPASVISGSSTRGMVSAAPSAPETFEAKFWNYLIRSKYRNWAPVPGESDAEYEGQSPHGAYLKMFLNRKAAGNVSSLPYGSIVIKENYNAAKSLAAITVMYKTRGYNDKAGDWYWVKYNPDGTVATKPTETSSVRLAGRVKGCIECHGDAEGDDFVFFND